MDPVTTLGVVSNGLQLAELAFQVFINLARYYKELHNAPKESKCLRDEIDDFVNLLNEIEDSAVTGEISVRAEREFDNARKLLTELLHRTEPRQVTGLRKLLWPFEKKETLEILKKLERSKSNLRLLSGAQSQFFFSTIGVC